MLDSALRSAAAPVSVSAGSSSINAVIFDLDGTLLNTLPDLVALTNAVLRESGYPQRTTEEVLSFVGSGVLALIRLAVPAGTSPEGVEAASRLWQKLYPQYGYRLTEPYPGIPEALVRLKGKGLKLAVLSNKFDAATREVVEAFFPGVFDAVHGESPDYPRKPDPTGLLKTLDELGSAPERCLFVGDSSNDIRVARAVDAQSVGVTWGYGGLDVLRAEGAGIVIDDARELPALVGA